jgi:hypothetical protein
MNVGVAIFASSRRMGIGAMILDHQGQCLAGFSEHLLEFTTPELAEALAIRRAISFAQTDDHRFLIVAFDCLSLIHRLNDPAIRPGCSSGMYQIDGSIISDLQFQAYSPGLNSVSHHLARSNYLVFLVFMVLLRSLSDNLCVVMLKFE